MSKDEQAIKPTFSVTPAQEVEDIAVEDVETIDREDSVADLKYHLGFQEIRKLIERRIDDHKSGAFINAMKQDDFEAIGRKYLVSSLVAAELQAVLGVIDGAAEAKQDRS